MLSLKKISEAYYQGYISHNEHLTLADNPFEDCSVEFLDWEHGFMLALAHESDNKAVDVFSVELKHQLEGYRSKLKENWRDHNEISTEFLIKELIHNFFSGNENTFKNIATVAMMLHQRHDDPSELTPVALNMIDELRDFMQQS